MLRIYLKKENPKFVFCLSTEGFFFSNFFFGLPVSESYEADIH